MPINAMILQRLMTQACPFLSFVDLFESFGITGSFRPLPFVYFFPSHIAAVLIMSNNCHQRAEDRFPPLMSPEDLPVTLLRPGSIPVADPAGAVEEAVFAGLVFTPAIRQVHDHNVVIFIGAS